MHDGLPHHLRLPTEPLSRSPNATPGTGHQAHTTLHTRSLYWQLERPAGPRGSRAWRGLAATVGALGGVDLAGEVADAGVDGGEDAADGAPVCAALAALKAADEGGIYPQPLSNLFLRYPRPLAQCAERVSEDELVLLRGEF